MGNITEKRKWEIAEKLSMKMDVNTWERYAANAEMNTKLVVKNDMEWVLCLNVVKAAVEQDKLVALIKAIKKDYDNDIDLVELIGELENGYKDKLDKLAKTIARDQCILFLGPGVLSLNNGSGFNDEFSKYLKKQIEGGTVYFDPEQEGNLTYTVQRFYKLQNKLPGEAGFEAKKFFASLMKNDMIDMDVFEELNKIPWKLVINANPDQILAQMMNQQKPGSCLCRKYSISNNIDDKLFNYQVSNDFDLIRQDKKAFFYNLFGTFDEDEQSILYTEADFLEFINGVVNNKPPLHGYVTSIFDDKKHYLFLGFDFDQWYFKILAKTLKIQNKEERAISWTTNTKKFSECNLDFFEQEFKFHFVREDNIRTFLKQLVKSYDKVK